MGYDEINLNCGCPSDRVHSGAFGACLMKKPSLVAECVAAMRAAVSIPVTVKLAHRRCRRRGDSAVKALSRRESAREAAARFGAAEHAALEEFVGGIVAAGCDAIIVHARKAVLGAWSPRDNREIPPLRYDVVRALKARFAPVTVVLNGGLRTPEQVVSELAWADGVMLGREAYHRPMLLAELSSSGRRRAPSRMADARANDALCATRDGARRATELDHASHAGACMRACRAPRNSDDSYPKARATPKAPAELLLEAGEACERLSDAAA